MSANAESVRVICRFRPQREQLVRGGGQGGSTVPTGKGGLGHIGRPAAGAGGGAAPSGFALECAQDGKSLSYTMPAVVSTHRRSIPLGHRGTASKPAAGGLKNKPTLFTFDAVLEQDSSQQLAFDTIAKDTIADVLKGYNGSIFAFGQTGSGKTFTMVRLIWAVWREFGPSTNRDLRGVIPRAADALFSGIATSEDLDEVTIKCSFCEIYMEGIRDLLCPKSKGLKIRELPTGEVYVQNLSEQYVASADEIMSLLAAGEKNRSTASTEMNEVSSRSHSVLIVVVNMKLKDGTARVGKLNLADLAGSERVERTNASGNTLEEAKKINQSLSALGNCINALTDSKRTHTPFRDSVLTFLLKDSLGGNTKTTLLVCASPEENDCLETLSTLNFAKRAKRIKNVTSVNLKMGVAELTLLVAELKKELSIANKTIVALQKTVGTLVAGGTIPKHMIEELLKPMAGAIGGGGGGGASTDASAGSDAAAASPSPPASSVPADVLATAMADAVNEQRKRSVSRYAVPSTPNQLHLLEGGGLLDADELRSPMLAAPHLPSLPASPAAARTAPAEEGADGAKEPLSPVRAQSELEASLRQAADAKLGEATAEIDSLRGQLESSHRAAEQREAEWAAERDRMRVEFEDAMQKASAVAATSTPAQAVPSPASASATTASSEPQSHPASPLTDPLIEALRSKNLRLEKQMAEMKETWTAYLDLILENQKAQAEQRMDYGYQQGQEGDGGQDPAQNRSAKVVKPIVVKPPARKSGGFFSTLRATLRKSITPASPSNEPSATDSPAAATSSSAATGSGSGSSDAAANNPTPRAHVRGAGQSGTYDRDGAPLVAGQSSAGSSSISSPSQGPATVPDHRRTGSSNLPSAPLSRTASASNRHSGTAFFPSSGSSLSAASAPPPAAASPGPSRSTFDQAIRIGYMSKKPVGFSLTRAWRNRLFVLRPTSLDYYDIHIQPSAGAGAGAGAEGDSLATTPDDGPATPLGSSTIHSSSSSLSSLTARNTTPGGFVAPSNLGDRLRGSIALDAQTSVVAVSYPEAFWGLEVTTRDKHTKMHAASDAERQGWMRDIVAVVDCMKRGVDPAVLVPGNQGAVLLDPSPEAVGADGWPMATDANGMTLDPHLIANANHLLQQALLTIPDASPTDRPSVAAGSSAPQNAYVPQSTADRESPAGPRPER